MVKYNCKQQSKGAKTIKTYAKKRKPNRKTVAILI